MGSHFDLKQADFVRVDTISQEVISNEKALIKFENHRVIVKLDQVGGYLLRLGPYEQSILILVVEAKPWEGEGQLLDEKHRQVITLHTNPHQLIGISTPKVKSDESGHTVEVQLTLPADIPLDSVRAHVISSAFIYNNVDQVGEIRKTLPPSSGPQTQQFTSKKCNYLSNKELSDEQCYVMNRQNEAKFVGNNLDKPRILLKRIEKRETTFDKEELKAEGEFKARSANNELKKAEMMMSRSRASKGAYMMADNMMGLVLQQITTKNNFLKHASSLTPNLHGKVLSFKVPLHHQYFKIVLTSQSFAIQRDFSLPETKLPTKDLRHTGLEDKDKTKQEAITMSREIYKLQKGESLTVKRNSLWTAVSSSNIAAYSAIKGAKVWEWLLEWSGYSPEKKQDTYGQHGCHELNVFLRSQDPQFFTRVVRPFIANKLQKTIVDLCLLQDPAAFEYARPERTAELNALQSCLLVQLLVKSKKIELAQAIASSMELKEKGNVIAGEFYQRQFDTIVTSKLIEERHSPNIGMADPFVAARCAPMPMMACEMASMDMMECRMAAPRMERMCMME